MEQLKTMKQCLMSCAQAQMSNLQNVDAKELGEVIDMIKDLEEACYYATITEAMHEGKDEIKSAINTYTSDRSYSDRDWDRAYGRMYYTEKISDDKIGRSYLTRKEYLQSREMHSDKAAQMHELEKYAQELAEDVLDMMRDATPEEKQMLQTKLANLAGKIK